MYLQENNLEIIAISMVEIYDQKLLHDMIKTKKFGFLKWKIADFDEYNTLPNEYSIDISNPRITK